MSGFDPDWLALREPADAAARNKDVLAACAAYFVKRESIVVVDLGCGAGSNLRALAPHLPRRQTWRLVDHDPALLAAARKTLIGWADLHEADGDQLRLEKAGATIKIDFVQADLARDIEGAMGARADLVTAAALFDLTSEAWMQNLCALLERRAAPLYAALTYNGMEQWSPAHAADAEMLAAFLAHQTGDKGFGPSAGPRAAFVLRQFLGAGRYKIVEGASDWNLGRDQAKLVEKLASGIVEACRETSRIDGATLASWLAARRDASARIGHVDLFATPS